MNRLTISERARRFNVGKSFVEARARLFESKLKPRHLHNLRATAELSLARAWDSSGKRSDLDLWEETVRNARMIASGMS